MTPTRPRSGAGAPSAKPHPLTIAFGEVLFDCFDDHTCIGGAPLNFAWYLRQFSLPVAMVSAVGRDAFGDQALALMREAGIDLTGVTRRPEPTGTVDVHLVEGQPAYIINTGVAWDHIEIPADFEAAPAFLCFGTLAQRTAVNRKNLARLLAAESAPALFDINLRQDFYSREILVDGLRRATVLKLNEEEWTRLAQLLSVQTPAELLARHHLEMIALTRGAAGAELHTPGAVYLSHSPRVSVVDAVGAGDAFSAVLAAGLLYGADPQDTLELACKVGAYVVQQRGAQVRLPRELRGAFDAMPPRHPSGTSEDP